MGLTESDLVSNIQTADSRMYPVFLVRLGQDLQAVDLVVRYFPFLHLMWEVWMHFVHFG